MRRPTDAEIAAATDRPFDSTDAVRIPGDPDAVKKTISARVGEATVQWIYDEALKRRISPSLLASELIGEAIAMRTEPRRVIDADAVVSDVGVIEGWYASMPDTEQTITAALSEADQADRSHLTGDPPAAPHSA